MPGAKVTATATYCGHTLQAETDVELTLGSGLGRCVVEGPSFQGTVVLHSPFPSAGRRARGPVEGGPALGWTRGGASLHDARPHALGA